MQSTSVASTNKRSSASSAPAHGPLVRADGKTQPIALDDIERLYGEYVLDEVMSSPGRWVDVTAPDDAVVAATVNERVFTVCVVPADSLPSDFIVDVDAGTITAETSPHNKPWQFRRGNKLGRGNPLAGRVAQFRARLLKQITTADFDAITAKLIDMAKAGDLGAIRKGLDRLFGKPRQERTKHIDRAIRTIAEGERTNLDRKRQRRRRYQLSAGGTGVT